MSTALLTAAIDRDDVAHYVDSLFLVFVIMIFARIAISWVVTFRGSLPYNRPCVRSRASSRRPSTPT